MFATVKCYSCFWLLLLLVPSLLDHAYAQQNIGDRCFTPQGPGVCQLSDQCPSVFTGFKTGNRPITCGFEGNILIVCCPSQIPSPPQTTTVRAGEIVTQNVTTQSMKPPSKRECREYESLLFSPQSLVKVGMKFIYSTTANVIRFPHMAAVGFNSTGSMISWSCGGTLISDRFVLTAAHCLYHIQWGDAQWVRLGYLGPNKSISEPQVIRIIEKIRHPDYKALMKYNDIALLKLERSVTFTPFIWPACLDTEENHPAGEEAWASGWGLAKYSNDESQSVNFLKLELPIVAHSNCASLYGESPGLPHGIDDRTQICAGGNGQDTCHGDSGDALIIKKKALSLFRVIGITSFERGCGGEVPGVYTRVSPYVSWIEGIVWPDKLA